MRGLLMPLLSPRSLLLCSSVMLTACVDETVPNACDEMSAQSLSLQPGAADHLLARAYDEGTWPDDPRTEPEILVGEQYLLFPSFNMASSDEFAVIAPHNTFLRNDDRWASDPFTLPLVYDNARERIARARQHFVDAGLDRTSDVDSVLEGVRSCPDSLRGVFFHE